MSPQSKQFESAKGSRPWGAPKGIARDKASRGSDVAKGLSQGPCAAVRLQAPATPRQRGFTLVELMVVIVIIGLLATVVAINVLPSQDRAMLEKARADVAVLEQAVETYRLENLAYPRTDEGLDALLVAPAGLARPERYRQGGYIRRLPTDPWGNPYQYRQPGKRGAFDVFSFGADGVEGGDGDGADIGNWN